MELTRDDIAALKRADNVTFHTYRGEAHMRAHLETYGTEHRIYTAREQLLFPLSNSTLRGRYRDVHTEHSGMGYLEEGGLAWTSDNTPHYSAFNAFVDRHVWGTIVGSMRVGDVVTLISVAGNGNGYLKEAGLFKDDFRIELSRDGKNPRTFLANTSVCADNSARMVKRYG